MDFRTLFRADKPVIGMVHLLPLPGSPGWGGSMEAVLERALADARAWAEGGASALLVENYGDVPFHPESVEPHTIAAMTLAVAAVREATALPVGVNVLRNDARAALGIAAATGARFIRVNVHTGAMVTDQGLLQGRAHETLRLRRSLGAPVLLFADLLVKHAVPLGEAPLEQAAHDGFERGLADALVVSGIATGQPTPLADVRRVKDALPEAPLLVGSGVTSESIAGLLRVADGVIVGSSAKVDGRAENPVDMDRARALIQAAGRAR
ncbi:MAG TPA: BtpA/SgcQ family protein [Armatimonadetes bacterium]|jgi:membrane complex biogenesis BtpA family protein|nr:BtpA/SgcQ family protein [Armatimonadota bacterium]